jgi:hypothetical protein
MEFAIGCTSMVQRPNLLRYPAIDRGNGEVKGQTSAELKNFTVVYCFPSMNSSGAAEKLRKKSLTASS